MDTASDITLSLCKTIDVVFEEGRQISPCQDRRTNGCDDRLPGLAQPGSFSVRDCSFVWEEAKRTNKVSYLGDCFVKTTQQLFNHLNHGTLTAKEKATIVNFLLESGAIKMKVETARLTIPEAAPDGPQTENIDTVVHHDNGTYSIIPKNDEEMFTPPHVQGMPGIISQTDSDIKPEETAEYEAEVANQNSSRKISTTQLPRVYKNEMSGSIGDESAFSKSTEQVSFVESVTYPGARSENDDVLVSESTDTGVVVKKEPESDDIVYMCSQEDGDHNLLDESMALNPSVNQQMKVIRPHTSHAMSAAGHSRKIRHPRKLNLSFRKFGMNKKKYTLPPSGEKLFLCELCTAGFDSKMKLTAHMKTHNDSGEKIYECKDCKKKFTDEASYVVHQQFHIQTGETPYQCELCGKAFKFKNRLIAHMRTHTGEKPFECTLCGKRFNDRSNLNAHRRIHSGEKPYACSVCGARFGHRSNHRKHTKRHHVNEESFIEQ